MKGCLGVAVTLIVLWAVLFGVTVGGKHYGLRCDSHKGVVIDM